MKGIENMKKKESEDTKKEKIRLSKIVYFDEPSVTDYVQINDGGELISTIELLSNESKSDNADIKASIGANIGISKLFKSLVGFSADVEAKGSKESSFQNDRLVRNILQNTILTDFLAISNKQYVLTSEVSGIRLFDGYNLEVAKNSLSYMIMVSPYLTMFKGAEVQKSQAGLDIAMDKIDSAIRLAKGYYEFIGVKDSEKVVLRFNIEGFKNNYKISDLLKMDIIMFAIKVGKIEEKQLAIDEEFVIKSSKKIQVENPEYGQINSKENIDQLNVYDVLLAGVKE